MGVIIGEGSMFLTLFDRNQKFWLRADTVKPSARVQTVGSH